MEIGVILEVVDAVTVVECVTDAPDEADVHSVT